MVILNTNNINSQIENEFNIRGDYQKLFGYCVKIDVGNLFLVTYNFICDGLD